MFVILYLHLKYRIYYDHFVLKEVLPRNRDTEVKLNIKPRSKI